MADFTDLAHQGGLVDGPVSTGRKDREHFGDTLEGPTNPPRSLIIRPLAGGARRANRKSPPQWFLQQTSGPVKLRSDLALLHSPFRAAE